HFSSTYSCCLTSTLFFYFFNASAPTEIYTLSLHDALPIYDEVHVRVELRRAPDVGAAPVLLRKTREQQPLVDADVAHAELARLRSEEHTSELQSRENLVCRLLLEKKKKNNEQAYKTENQPN